MFPAVDTIMPHAGKAALAVTAAVCVLALSSLALVLTLVLAPPLKRLRVSGWAAIQTLVCLTGWAQQG